MRTLTPEQSARCQVIEAEFIDLSAEVGYTLALSHIDRKWANHAQPNECPFRLWQTHRGAKLQNYGSPDREASIEHTIAARAHMPTFVKAEKNAAERNARPRTETAVRGGLVLV